MDMVDLDRLKIAERPRQAAPRARGAWLLGGCIGLAAGLALGLVIARRPPAAPAKVATAVVGAPEATGRGFSAGGWISVPSPDYPVVVAARIAQRLDAVSARQGDAVAPGQVLARLYDADARARLAAAEARAQSAREEAAKMRAGSRPEDVRAAESRAREAEARMALARATVERTARLEPGAVAAEQADRERAEMNVASQAWAAASAEAEKLRAGFRREEVAAAEAALHEAEALAALASNELSYCTVTAPGDVALRVLAVYHAPGDWIGMGREAALLALYDPSNMQARVDVSQANLRFVKVGGKARVKTEANPQREYAAVVVRLDPLAELAKNTITARLRIEDPDELLFPDMVAHVVFLPDASSEAGRPGETLIPRQAVLDAADGPSVYMVQDGRARKTRIRIGSRTDSAVVVTGGLSSGQRIVTAGAETLRDGDAVETE
jgi:HlyD family secretion protein